MSLPERAAFVAVSENLPLTCENLPKPLDVDRAVS